MTTRETRLVKQTWAIFKQIDPVIIGDVFYSKLFSDHPRLRSKFPANMEAEYRHLIDWVNAIVSSLEWDEACTERMNDLSKRFSRYLDGPGHYRLIGDGLLWTLEQGLGSDWTAEVRDAWRRCYQTLADNVQSRFSLG